MKQAVKSALGLGGASATSVAPLGGVSGVPYNTGYSNYGPTIGTIPVTQTVTVPTVVDTVETINQPVLSQTTTVQKQVIPAIVEHREVAPVVHQRIRQEEVEEIQPIIHREREKTEIHKILQPMYTTSTMGIAAEERTLAAQVRPEIRLQGGPAPATILPTTQYESAQRVRVDKAPIVMETERKRIIEEVQPVVYKEIIQPHVIHVTQDIYEKIVEADVYVERVLPATTFMTPVTTTISAPISAPISATSINIAEPTSAFTQTYDINTPVNVSGITSNRIEGVSQGLQVAPIGVSVQPLQSGFQQQTLGIQQPMQSFSSSSIQPLQSQSYLGNQASFLGSQGGLAQPGFSNQMLPQQQQLGFQGSQFGMQQPLGFQQSGLQPQMGLSQSNLGMQPGFQQSSLGMQPGFQQSGFQQSGLGMQPGFQQSGLGQQGFSQGLGQQSGLGSQQGLGQGMASGLGQQLGSQLGGQALGGVSKPLGSTLGGALGSALASAY